MNWFWVLCTSCSITVKFHAWNIIWLLNIPLYFRFLDIGLYIIRTKWRCMTVKVFYETNFMLHDKILYLSAFFSPFRLLLYLTEQDIKFSRKLDYSFHSNCFSCNIIREGYCVISYEILWVQSVLESGLKCVVLCKENFYTSLKIYVGIQNFSFDFICYWYSLFFLNKWIFYC